MDAHPLDRHPLRSLFTATGARSRRASSWDRTGGNVDFVRVGPGETRHAAGGRRRRAASPTSTSRSPPRADRLPRRDPALLLGRRGDAVGRGAARRLLRRHPRPHPRVQQRVHRGEPGHGLRRRAATRTSRCRSPPARASRSRTAADTSLGGGCRHGLVPHRVRDVRRSARPTTCCASTPSTARSDRPSPAVEPPNMQLHDGVNLDGAENYVALDAQRRRARWSGCVLEIDNLAGGWYGEGDDMVFIDGDAWPPRIHGTGTRRCSARAPVRLREYAGPVLRLPPGRARRLRRARRHVPLVRRRPDPLRRSRSAGRSSTATPTTSRTTTRRSRTGTRPSRTRRSRRCPSDAMRPPLPAPYDEARAAFFSAGRGRVGRLRAGVLRRVAAVGELLLRRALR